VADVKVNPSTGCEYSGISGVSVKGLSKFRPQRPVDKYATEQCCKAILAGEVILERGKP
jgi:hypothetical protein